MKSAVRRFLFPLWLAVALALATSAALEVRSVWRDRSEPNAIVIPLRVDRRGPAQLFYDVGRGLNEADSVTQLAWPTAQPRELRLPVPGPSLRQLRFDPLPGAGVIEIGAVRLETASGFWLATLPLSAIRPQHQIATLQPRGDLLRIATVPDANDPRLEIALPAPVTFAPRRFPVGWIAGAALFALIGLAFRSEGLQLIRFLRGRIVTLAAPDGVAGFWAGAFLAGALQLWLLWPLHRVLDLPLWDEAGYMSWSTRWAEPGSPGRHLFNCPLYVLQYLAELRLLGDTGAAFFFHHYFFKIATTVLLYAIVARACRCWPAALSLVLIGAVSAFQAEQPIMVYQAALFWLLLAILFAEASPLNALACLLLAACVRQEYQFAFAAFAGWLLWRRARHRLTWAAIIAPRSSHRRLALATSLPLFALASYVLSHVAVTGSSARAWFAFQQHYAVRAVAEGRATGINPWIDYPQLIARDFPGIHSLAAAARAHPAKVAGHVARNLAHVPGALLDLMRPRAAQWTTTAVFVAALVGFMVWWRRDSQIGADLQNAPPPPGAGHLEGRGPARERREYERGQISKAPSEAGLRAGTAVALAAIPGLAPGLFIYAKDAYLLAALPGLALAVCGLLARFTRVTPLPIPRPRNRWLPLLGVLVVSLTALAADRPFAIPTPERPLAETIAALDLHWPQNHPVKLLAAPAVSYCIHLGPERCTAVEGLGSVFGNTRGDAAFGTLLAKAQPDVVLLTPDWTGSAGFDRAGAVALLQARGWTALPLARGTAFFAPHDPVLP